jgi:hypothetical protein
LKNGSEEKCKIATDSLNSHNDKNEGFSLMEYDAGRLVEVK